VWEKVSAGGVGEGVGYYPSVEALAAAQKLTDSEMEISSQRPCQSRVKPNPSNVGIKAIQLQEGSPSKTTLIGGGLNDK
jgi:hypothetical protein